MGSIPYTNILLDLLEEQEKKIGALYERFAEAGDEHAPFWKKLAAEEKGHAAWIRSLRSRITMNEISVDPEVFRLEELQRFSRMLNDLLETAKTEKWSFSRALAVAADVERQTLDQPFSKVFRPNTEGTTALLGKFVEENRRHAEDLEAMLRKLPSIPELPELLRSFPRPRR